MNGNHADLRSDGQIEPVSPDHAVLFGDFLHGHLAIGLQESRIRVGEAETLVPRHAVYARVRGQGLRTGVRHEIVFVAADHRGQHRQGDIGNPGYADTYRKQVEKNIVPGPYFRQALETLRGQDGRRGAHGNLRHGKAVRQQGVAHRDHGAPFLFRGFGGLGPGFRTVHVAGVGQDAAEFKIRVIVDHPSQLPDTPILRQQAASVQSHVDFKKQSDGLPMDRRPLARYLDAFLRIGHHAHLGASILRCGQQPIPLRWRDHRPGDGDGFEPALEEYQRLVHRGHGHARCAQPGLSPADLQGLVGLGMGTQCDAVPVRQILHGAQIGHHPGLIEQYRGRFYLMEQ